MEKIVSMCVWNESDESFKSHDGYVPVGAYLIFTPSGVQSFVIYFSSEVVLKADVFQMADFVGQTVTKELLLVFQKSSMKMGAVEQ